MQKKLIAVVSILVFIVIVSGVGIYLFFRGLFEEGLFNPPIDFSGINLSSDLAREELLPAQLIDEPLNIESVVGRWRSGLHYYVQTTEAEYNGITLRVWKAETLGEAKSALESYSDDLFSGSRQRIVMPSWFTIEGDVTNVFAWTSDVWVFGVEAGNIEARNQAAAEWIQELRSR